MLAAQPAILQKSDITKKKQPKNTPKKTLPKAFYVEKNIKFAVYLFNMEFKPI